MKTTCCPKRLMMAFAAVAIAVGCTPAAAQNGAVEGVWRTREGIPSGTMPGVSASDIQTLYLTADGQYRREIIVEGGDGVTGAGGTIVDSGEYRFSSPQTFQYRRRSWMVCTFAGCLPGQPIGPNVGTLPFQPLGQGQAIFLQLTWTKIR
jgi:hypothetical protein